MPLVRPDVQREVVKTEIVGEGSRLDALRKEKLLWNLSGRWDTGLAGRMIKDDGVIFDFEGFKGYSCIEEF